MWSSASRRVFIVGGEITPFSGKGTPGFLTAKQIVPGQKENPDLSHYISKAVNGAFASTGCEAKLVQKAWVGNFAGELFSSQGHLGSALAGSHPDLRFVPALRTEAACASGGVAFASAINDIKAGLDVVLVAGAEVQNTVSARKGGDYLARASDYKRQRSLDEFTFPALFARRMKAYRTHYGVSEEDMAHISVQAYSNANKNPLAHMRAVKMTLERATTASSDNPTFLGNLDLKPWLKTSDCSQVSDGGAALIMVSEEGLRMLDKKPSDAVEVVAVGEAADNLYVDGNPLEMTTTKVAAQRAYSLAGLKPADIQVAEVHDCFSLAFAQMCEALGWAEPGKGAYLARDGVSTLDGKIPVNTGGGLIAFGHPVGATGIKQILEIYRQMKGKCGDYQLRQLPEFGLAANMGGEDKTAVVSILKNL